MVRSRKILIYLLVVAVLVPAVLLSHADFAYSHAVASSAHDATTSQDCEPEFSTSGASTADHFGKSTSDHDVELGCGAGDCCYPVPTARANHGEKKGLEDRFDIVSPALLDRRLDPPPPRTS